MGPNLHPSSQSYRPVILPRDGVRSRQPRLRADDCTQNAQIKDKYLNLFTCGGVALGSNRRPMPHRIADGDIHSRLQQGDRLPD
jgi:hypothetical protein